MFRLGRSAFGNFLRAEAKTSAVPGSGLRLRLVTPHETMVDKVVKQISVPSTEGTLGVTAQHVPTIAQLKPGLVTVMHSEGEVKKYFISGGFAVVEANSVANVSCVECIPISDIDLNIAKKLLDEQIQNKGKASSEKDKAEAQIGTDLYTSLIYWCEH